MKNSITHNWRAHATIFLSGFLMGTADVIPGVSGGTVAFVLGIYEELIDAIRAAVTLWTPPGLSALERGL